MTMTTTMMMFMH